MSIDANQEPVSFRSIEISDPALTPAGASFVTVKSAALKRRSDVSFYVPQGLAPDARLPVVILMHGVYGSHWAWLYKGGAHEVLERLIREEGLPPMMLAMPSDGLWGDGSGYLRHREADHRRWITEEIPAIAMRVCAGVAGQPLFISGLSMGGYGALRLGALHPELFSGISAHSSITDVRQMMAIVEETMEHFFLADDEPLDVLACLKMNAAKLPPLRFDCGTEDDLIGYNRWLHHELELAGIPHAYEEFPGAHEWPYWHDHLADTLRFFAAQMKK